MINTQHHTMPPLPSPTAAAHHSAAATPKPTTAATGKPPTVSRRPGSAASVPRPSSVASVRNSTPKAHQSTVASQQRAVAAKQRGGSDKENGTDHITRVGGGSRAARRQTSAGILTREKLPSKDGTAQKNAKGVDGLKDYVSISLRHYIDGERGWDESAVTCRTGRRFDVGRDEICLS